MLTLLSQIADGLSVVHACSIIHRDVKGACGTVALDAAKGCVLDSVQGSGGVGGAAACASGVAAVGRCSWWCVRVCCCRPCGCAGANILITNTGIAKLADFGCSKVMDDMKTPTATFMDASYKRIKGTVPYMAPEGTNRVVLGCLAAAVPV